MSGQTRRTRSGLMVSERGADGLIDVTNLTLNAFPAVKATTTNLQSLAQVSILFFKVFDALLISS